MDWFFDGLGTFLLGLILGTGGGYRLAIRRVRQSQRAGNFAQQTQVGGDQHRSTDG
ncbi:MAG: hypothetical protein QOC82_1350 [Frankiaceae bacterium]|jgi:hypothetical protein|nr:hypothetical protein [Frankiaceae bacterium]